MTTTGRHLLVGAAVAVFAVALHQRAMSAGPALPDRLSETGILTVQGPGSKVQGSGSAVQGPRPFSPQYPLWTDGAAKQRWVYLPEGTTIDASNPDRWVFPDGTKFWKDFSFGGRKVETRMLWKHDGEWQFATYAWNEEQTDALLVPEGGLTTTVEVAPGKPHRIPSRIDCRACHVSDRAEVLGFDALQLSPDRDPHALHADPLTPEMVTLRTLLDEGRLAGAPDDWRTTPPRITAADAETRTLLGYLSTNCGSCHNKSSDIATLNFDLKASSTTEPCAAPLTTAIDRPSRWTPPNVSFDDARRIAPGRPDLSTMLARMRSRRPSSQMPPLGTAVADAEAIALLTRWIERSATSDRKICNPEP